MNSPQNELKRSFKHSTRRKEVDPHTGKDPFKAPTNEYNYANQYKEEVRSHSGSSCASDYGWKQQSRGSAGGLRLVRVVPQLFLQWHTDGTTYRVVPQLLLQWHTDGTTYRVVPQLLLP